MTCVVRPNSSKKISKECLDLCEKGCLENCTPLLVIRTVQICTVQPSTKKMEQRYTKKIALGFVSSFSLGNVPSKLLTFLSQAYSENLSHSTPLIFSMCLAHYLMDSFINLKMTFSLRSVFSPSPTLNPKAKIRSFLFQDQGS
jgi:hypothetical protein